MGCTSSKRSNNSTSTQNTNANPSPEQVNRKTSYSKLSGMPTLYPLNSSQGESMHRYQENKKKQNQMKENEQAIQELVLPKVDPNEQGKPGDPSPCNCSIKQQNQLNENSPFQKSPLYFADNLYRGEQLGTQQLSQVKVLLSQPSINMAAISNSEVNTSPLKTNAALKQNLGLNFNTSNQNTIGNNVQQQVKKRKKVKPIEIYEQQFRNEVVDKRQSKKMQEFKLQDGGSSTIINRRKYLSKQATPIFTAKDTSKLVRKYSYASYQNGQVSEKIEEFNL